MTYIPYIDPDHYGDFFQIDDVSTPIDPAAEHFVLSGSGTYGAPERDVEAIAIPGRSGDLIFDNGRFTNAEVFYDIGWAQGFGGELMHDNGANNLIPLLSSAWSEELYRVQISYNGSGAFTFNRAVGAGAGAAIIISDDFHLTRGSYFLSVPTAGAVVLGIAEATTASTATEVFGVVDCRDRGGYVAIPYDTDACLVLVAHDGEGFENVTVSPTLVTSQAARNPYTGFDYFRGRLMTKSNGYYKLVDSYHPGEFRLARVARIEELELGALNDSGKCRVVFDCKPQRYSVAACEYADVSTYARAGQGFTTDSIVPTFVTFYDSRPKFKFELKNSDGIRQIAINIISQKYPTQYMEIRRANGNAFSSGTLEIDCDNRVITSMQSNNTPQPIVYTMSGDFFTIDNEHGSAVTITTPNVTPSSSNFYFASMGFTI